MPESPLRIELQRFQGWHEPYLEPAARGRWVDLPPGLSAQDLGAIAHLVNGYEVAERHLGRQAFDVAAQLRQGRDATGAWKGTAVELLVGFFAVVRGWRWSRRDFPRDGDSDLVEARSLFEALQRRLREHPGELELMSAENQPGR